jgi:TonB family protein
MSLRPVPRLDPSFHRPEPLVPSDLTHDLEQHVIAGFPVDLALDLVLNELAVRAASVTGSSGAAVALIRDDQMVIRAATGSYAPDLGVPLSTRDGLSGACVRTLRPQLSNDVQSDSRVDPTLSRELGIRSMLITPVLDDSSAQGGLLGVLEVLSCVPHAFSESSQALLTEFSRECASLCRTATELRDRASDVESIEGESVDPQSTSTESTNEPTLANGELFRSFELADSDFPESAAPARQPYQVWTLILASLVILAAIALSFMVGSRIGWVRALATPPPAPVSPDSTAVEAKVNAPAVTAEETQRPAHKKKVAPPQQTDPSNAPMSPSDQLVVYEKGKVVYRMKAQPLKPQGDAVEANATPQPAPSAGQQPAPNAAAQPAPSSPAPNPMASSVVAASSKQRLSDRVWLTPDQAASLLVNRVEPQYPQEAVAAHRSGKVVLEVNVAEDGSVSSVRPLIGDPTLAAAAVQAVRSWRYQPLRSNEQPSPFQTDVTFTFSLPN